METTYLNFPVAEIPFIVADRKTAMDQIMSYALVAMAKKRGITQKEAGKVLGIKIGNAESNKWEARECSRDSKSFTSIQTSMAFEFRDKSKTDFDVTCLCANLAVRSIVGKHSYFLVRKNLIFTRMSGKDKLVPPSSYKPYVKKLDGEGGRRRWDKVRTELETVYGLSVYAPRGTRGMYMSYVLSPEELAFSVESMIARKKKRQARNNSAELQKKARQQLWVAEHVHLK